MSEHSVAQGVSGLKAIETRYKGYRFRSRLEARWAIFFDALGLQWEYEKEGFILPSGRYYLPDFWIEGLGWFEIKPKPANFDGEAWPVTGSLEEEFFVADDDAFDNKNAYQGQKGGILYGTPGPAYNFDYDGISFYAGTPGHDSPYYFCECSGCGSINFEYCGRSERGIHPQSCPFVTNNRYREFNPNSPRILAAAEKARSARFEHGESPR